MSENFQEEVDTITNLATTRYQNRSIIRRICNLRPNPNLQDFEPFNQSDRRNQTGYQVNQPRVRQMIDRLIVSETNYLINEIDNHSIHRDAQEDIRQSIQDAVTELFTNGFDPFSIIVPRSLMMDMVIWSREIDPTGVADRTILDLGLGFPLNVDMPAQNVEFNQIMILSNQSNIWEFIPGQNDSSLQIGFQFNNTEIAFWLREQCKFRNDENDGIISLNLPIEQLI
ncbi:MAG: hypothetical protein OEM89_02385 [Nitrosopumilus sp.]|nr:hypothetical protein [Nitrosopumilus sp.]